MVNLCYASYHYKKVFWLVFYICALYVSLSFTLISSPCSLFIRCNRRDSYIYVTFLGNYIYHRKFPGGGKMLPIVFTKCVFSIWKKRGNERKYLRKSSTQVLLTSCAMEGIKKFDMNQRIVAEVEDWLSQHMSQHPSRKFIEKPEISKLNFTESLASRVPDMI